MNHSFLLEQTQKSELFQLLEIELVEAVKERVVLKMPVTSRVHQYVGIMNGGISLLLAESAASIGAVINTDLSKQTAVGIEINANHLRSVSKGVIKATATPIYHGRTLSVWQVEIRNDRDKLICVSRCTLALKTGAAFPQC
ncbi:MAG: hotdog fold thioesterase [Acidobacteriota bacterium]|nr:hotdog fold thioesterase [Acidobacteriota bacterium]